MTDPQEGFVIRGGCWLKHPFQTIWLCVWAEAFNGASSCVNRYGFRCFLSNRKPMA